MAIINPVAQLGNSAQLSLFDSRGSRLTESGIRFDAVKDIRIDINGTPRCWNCGSSGFTEKRTFRSKAMLGVGALLTKKKLKCQRCGEYNDAGNGRPYQGPAARKYRKEYEKEMKARGLRVEPEAPDLTLVQEIAQLADLRNRGALTEAEFQAQKAKLLDND